MAKKSKSALAKTASTKSVKSKATATATAKKPAKSAVKATVKPVVTPTKKSAAPAKTASKSKPQVKKPVATKVAAMKPKASKPAAQSASAKSASVSGTIKSIRPSNDGQSWLLSFDSQATVTIPLAAAQAVGVKVGAAWNAAQAARVTAAASSQRLFTSALEFLASKGSATRAEVNKVLGGGKHAANTVKELVSNGWLR